MPMYFLYEPEGGGYEGCSYNVEIARSSAFCEIKHLELFLLLLIAI